LWIIKDFESILLVALYNLHLIAINERRQETEFFHENEIIDFINKHFDALCYFKQRRNFAKPMPDQLKQCFQNTEIFKKGQQEYWGLVKYENPLLTHVATRNVLNK